MSTTVIRTEEITEGLTKEVLREGKENGKIPPKGSKVQVHYTGWLLDGTKFDSSRDRNDEFEFTLGQQMVIKGWDMGVATMKEGELANLICRSDYAYGKSGSPPKIPADATLKFEVELLSFEEEEKKEWEMNIEEKINNATIKKEKGNDYFKENDLTRAIKEYEKSISLIENAYDASDSDKDKINSIKVSCNNNLAACKIKTKDFSSAIVHCNKALDVDENNAKAYFRMGQAYALRGDFKEAKENLLRAEKLNPDDVAIKKELQNVAKKEAEYKKKDREMAKKMFS